MQPTMAPPADGLDRGKLHFVDVDGIRTRYYEDGDGPPLVLFHGGQYGSLYSLDAWSLNLPTLAQHFHVYAVDKLGQGYTDIPTRDEDYTFEALYAHARGFVQQLGIRDAHLAGHSRGAFLAARLALGEPGLARSLILVDTDTTAPPVPGIESGVFYTELARRTPPGPPTRDTVRMEPDAQAYWPAQVTDDFVNRLLAMAQQPRVQQAQARFGAIAQQYWFPSLERQREATFATLRERGFPVPTLLVWGYDDRSAPLRAGYALFDLICQRTPHAEMHVLRGAGHYSFRDQYAKFHRLLRAFCLE